MSRFWVVLYHVESDSQRTVLVWASTSTDAMAVAAQMHPGHEAIAAGLQRGAR